jgi:hypothetical protein
VLYGVERSTVSAAIRQIRPLLANRGFATPSGQRLHTLADLLAYAVAEGLTVRLDGTEIQVRRPKANQPGRRAFVSGKKRQNDQTAMRTEGIDGLVDAYPEVKILVASATAAWPKTTPARSSPRHSNRRKTPQRAHRHPELNPNTHLI